MSKKKEEGKDRYFLLSEILNFYSLFFFVEESSKEHSRNGLSKILEGY